VAKNKKKDPIEDKEKAKNGSESEKGAEKGAEESAEKSAEKSSEAPATEAKTSIGKRFSLLTIVEIVFAVGVLVLLSFVTHWLAALSIASAVFVFFDAAINHVNKIKPTSGESRLALMVWSLVGFVPFVGVVAYAVLRKKLASAPARKVATGKEAVETVKRRMRAVPIPTAVVVAVVAVVIAFFSLPGPFTINFGTRCSKALRLSGTRSDNIYAVRTVYAKLESSEQIQGQTNLDWELFYDGGREPVSHSTVKVQMQAGKMIWAWRVSARKTGDYRLDVINDDGVIVKRGYFSTVSR